MTGYKDICPKCHKDNLWITPANGVSYCFTPGCDYKQYGTFDEITYEPSKHIDEIRDYYTEITEYYHTCLDNRAEQYLLQRGITHHTINTYKIGYVPSDVHISYTSWIAQESGIAYDQRLGYAPSLADRIVFPYWYKGNVTDIRGRSFDDDLRYKSAYGKVHFRGAIYPFNMDKSKAKVILFTEGEIKALLAEQAGYECIAVPGITMWRDGFTPCDNQRVIIVMDNQRKHKGIKKAIMKIANRFDDVYVASLPLFGKEKQDIDSYILEYGYDSFRRVIDSALDYNTWLSIAKKR